MGGETENTIFLSGKFNWRLTGIDGVDTPNYSLKSIQQPSHACVPAGINTLSALTR